MKKLSSTKEIEAIGKPKFKCEFCAGEYLRESTLLTHMCESKRRWMNKDLQGNRIAYQAFVQFYKKNSSSKKTKTNEEFIKSPYYTAFVKFGNHCVEINALNVSRYADWLVKSQIRIDTWCTDTNYTNYLLEYIRTEDPLDAIHRSIETTMSLAEIEILRALVDRIAQEVQKNNNFKVDYLVGTMIELPRAALNAKNIAKHADFFSFGTNDLTQTTLGFASQVAGNMILVSTRPA